MDSNCPHLKGYYFIHPGHVESRLPTSLLFILKPHCGWHDHNFLAVEIMLENSILLNNPVLPHFQMLTNLPVQRTSPSPHVELDTRPGTAGRAPSRLASGFWRKSSRSRHHQRGERPGSCDPIPPKKIENMGFSIFLHNGSELLYFYNGDFTSFYTFLSFWGWLTMMMITWFHQNKREFSLKEKGPREPICEIQPFTYLYKASKQIRIVELGSQTDPCLPEKGT